MGFSLGFACCVIFAKILVLDAASQKNLTDGNSLNIALEETHLDVITMSRETPQQNQSVPSKQASVFRYMVGG
jgi:hypothetical protein